MTTTVKKPHQTTYLAAEPPKVPRVPEGYYSGDKSNPNLRAFVEQHQHERTNDHPADKRDVPAFQAHLNGVLRRCYRQSRSSAIPPPLEA